MLNIILLVYLSNLSVTLFIVSYSDPYGPGLSPSTDVCQFAPCDSVLRRWGNLPVDDALQFEHEDVVKILKDYQQVYSPGKAQLSGEEHSPRLDTIEVIA